MIRNTFFILGLMVLAEQYCSCQALSIDTQFDRGSIGSFKEVSPGFFRGQTMHWIKKDKVGNQYYWFYFKISGSKGKTIRFELDNLSGVYRGGSHQVYTDYTQPVISYDQDQWERIREVNYDGEKETFTFTVTLKKKTAWIAYAHPYTFTQSEAYVDQILQSPWAHIAAEGRSPENRPVRILEITSPDSSQSKKSVFIQAIQHAGEDAGGYFMEGLIDFLLSQDPVAVSLRENFIFFLVPMLNPDGTYQGCSRYNTNMEDLNAEWDDDLSDAGNFPVEPEVQFIKNWIRGYYRKGREIDLFIDLHNHTQFNTEHLVIGKGDQINRLTKLTSDFWPLGHRDSFENPGSATWFFNTRYNVLSGTLELSQSFVQEGKYLDIPDYRQYGAGFIKAIALFFKERG